MYAINYLQLLLNLLLDMILLMLVLAWFVLTIKFHSQLEQQIKYSEDILTLFTILNNDLKQPHLPSAKIVAKLDKLTIDGIIAGETTLDTPINDTADNITICDNLSISKGQTILIANDEYVTVSNYINQQILHHFPENKSHRLKTTYPAGSRILLINDIEYYIAPSKVFIGDIALYRKQYPQRARALIERIQEFNLVVSNCRLILRLNNRKLRIKIC